jgi:hypothetical protein
MRKLLFVALLASLGGCQALGGMFGGVSRTKREPGPAATPYAPDPLLNPDIDEQQRFGRSRYSYPDRDWVAGPPPVTRPSPSGR